MVLYKKLRCPYCGKVENLGRLSLAMKQEHYCYGKEVKTYKKAATESSLPCKDFYLFHGIFPIFINAYQPLVFSCNVFLFRMLCCDTV